MIHIVIQEAVIDLDVRPAVAAVVAKSFQRLDAVLHVRIQFSIDAVPYREDAGLLAFRTSNAYFMMHTHGSAPFLFFPYYTIYFVARGSQRLS